MARNFTPTPWTIKKDSDGGYAFVEILGADKMQVAQLESAAGFDVETEADAHLIAAAPDLVAALAKLTALWADFTSQEMYGEHLRAGIEEQDFAAWDEAHREARAALAKAEGRDAP